MATELEKGKATAKMETGGPESLVDESFLLKVLREVVDTHILAANDVHGSQQAHLPAQESEQDGLAGRLEALWDLCVDASTASFLQRNRGVAVFSRATCKCAEAAASAHGDLESEAERRGEKAQVMTKNARCAEVCLGALGNICSHREVSVAFDQEDLLSLQSAALAGLASPHGVVVVQALRVVCSLLCGPVAYSCPGLWSGAAFTRYIFVLEHSLLWDAVKSVCDAMSQVIVLECSHEEIAGSCDTDPAGSEESGPPAVRRLLQEGLPIVLAGRISELAAAAEAEVVGDGECDVETTLLSAVCLADSFLSAAPSDCNEISAAAVPFASAALRVIAMVGRPDVLSATLDLLSTLLDTEREEQESKHRISESPGAAGEPPPISKLCISWVNTGPCAGTALVEKLTMLLMGMMEGNEAAQEPGAIAAALALLQHLPWEAVAEQREVLASATRMLLAADSLCPGMAASENSREDDVGSFARGLALSPSFLRRLGVDQSLYQPPCPA